jgi:hypothetical protein
VEGTTPGVCASLLWYLYLGLARVYPTAQGETLGFDRMMGCLWVQASPGYLFSYYEVRTTERTLGRPSGGAGSGCCCLLWSGVVAEEGASGTRCFSVGNYQMAAIEGVTMQAEYLQPLPCFQFMQA